MTSKFFFKEVLIFIIFLVAFYFIISEANIYLRNSAIDNCLQSASYTAEVGSEGGKNTTSEPMKNWYEMCMREKGY